MEFLGSARSVPVRTEEGNGELVFFRSRCLIRNNSEGIGDAIELWVRDLSDYGTMRGRFEIHFWASSKYLSVDNSE